VFLRRSSGQKESPNQYQFPTLPKRTSCLKTPGGFGSRLSAACY
jgi:hypothetical protein